MLQANFSLFLDIIFLYSISTGIECHFPTFTFYVYPRIIKENFAIFAVFIFANTKPKRIFAKLIFTDGKVLKILALKSTLKFLASM